jgi:diguanylate cyclase (GGDEF)-like protein/PAS domain S-box-containing protein
MDQESLADIVLSLTDGVVVIDRMGGIQWSNPAATRLLERSSAELTGTSILEVIHGDDVELARVALTSVQNKAVGTPLELRVGTAREWKLVEVVASDTVGRGPVGGSVLVLRRLAEGRRRHGAGAEVERFRALVHNAVSVILLVRPDGEIESASAAITRVLGHDQDMIEGRPFADLVAERDRPALSSALRRALEAPEGANGPTTVELSLRRRDSREPVDFELSIVNLVNDPTVGGLVISGHDISQRRAAQTALDGTSTLDPLTDLPNRAALCHRLERCLDDPKTAVIFLDLDGFKPINDRFGSEVGDELLRLLGDRLRQSVRRADFVARFGGDEFVVVARTENDRDLQKLSQRLVRAIEQPTEVSVGSIRLSASVGLARPYPQDTPETILARADTAMYTAKIHSEGLSQVVTA